MKKWGFLIIFLLVLLLPGQMMAAPKPPADGQYMVRVTLEGGTGRVQVESPATLTVTSGAATATVIWSSPYYEYMLIDGTYYYPINHGGNSTFEIPVSLDTDMAVSAQTIAMSEPHEISYTLHFDSATLKPLAGDGSPLTPLGAGAVAAAILIIILAGVSLLKKRQRESRI